jgi:2-aminoadipate transaminase
VENPAYLGALQAFDAYEASPVGIRCDDHGMIPDELRTTLRKLPAPPKFLYVIPNFQNPTGVSWSIERRTQVAQIASEFGVPIFEDDPYGRLRYAGEEPPPISALQGAESAIYTGTTSKIISPGMRVAWLVIRDHELYEKLIPAKQSADLHTSTFTQRVVWRYARQADLLKEHMRRLLDTYRRRRDTMLQALEQHMPEGCSWTNPDGGLFLWCTVPQGIDTINLLREATQHKVTFVPGAPFWVGKDIRNTLRLNFSNASEERIREGITRLGETLKKLLTKVDSQSPP